jgi:Domain of unknown function (DUF4167)
MKTSEHTRTSPNRNPRSFARARPQPARTSQNAQKSYERYIALANAETLNGDRIAAENYLQHAEHFFRSMRQSSHQP